jgi:hypothetical protein
MTKDYTDLAIENGAKLAYTDRYDIFIIDKAQLNATIEDAIQKALYRRMEASADRANKRND